MAKEKIVVDLIPGRNELKKAISGIGSTINTIGLAVGGILAGAGIKKVIDLANQQEDAVNRLNAQLKIAGDFSEEASKGFQEFASQLQKTSTFGDEVILNQIALAKSFGATNEQAQQIASTAADLAASFDIDLESATRNVAKTLGGFAGELGETIPELKELGSEALKTGKGIDLISERFKGAALEGTKTFSGSLKQLSNQFGDTLETIGQFITQNPIAKEFVTIIQEGLGGIDKILKDNADEITAFLKQIAVGTVFLAESLTKGIKIIVDVLNFGIKAYEGFINAALQIDIIRTTAFVVVNGVRDTFNDLLVLLVDTAKKIVDFGKSSTILSKSLGAAGFNLDKISKSLGFLSLGIETGKKNFEDIEISSVNFSKVTSEGLEAVSGGLGIAIQKFDGLGKRLGKVETQAKKTGAALKASSEIREGSGDGPGPRKIDIAFESTEELFNKAGENFEKFSNELSGNVENIVGFFKEGGGALTKNAFKFATDTGKALLAGIQQGAEGARNIIGSVVTGLGDKLLPGIGGVLGEAFKLLSLPPEEFRKVITEFIQSIPQIILNVFENAADFGIVLAEATIDALQGFFDRLPTFIPKIIDRIILGVPRIITKFVQSVPIIISSIASQTGVIVDSFIKTLIKDTPNIAKALVDSILDLLNPKNIFGGSGGGGLFGGIPIVGDVLGGIGSVFGFAEGGMVPDGFPNDTFPARLSSRELVIDRSLTDKLDSYLDGQRGNNDQTGLLNAILVELRRPVTVESNLEIDNRNFGRVILELNRDNERLEA